ncbi:MAG: AI-2E family transporter [Woeseiaceae bacterium]|nr:AI-2E family transporter [Woeseiaceae bacterium]NIP21863.1 AI-2E family transporter [Woeseiaceae bacterium]NIS90948.1 AI-2E family transporter [Woeseiaceae bacterium]
MNDSVSPKVDKGFVTNAIASFLQIGAILLLGYWCFLIAAPFIPVVVWAIVISVAIYPLHVSLTAKLGGRSKLSSTILALIGAAIVIVPMWVMGESTVTALKTVGAQLETGTAVVPPPNPSVAEWPVIGEQMHGIWSEAAEDLEGTLNRFEPQLKSMGERLIGLAGQTVVTALLFLVSILIAVAMLSSADSSQATAKTIAGKLASQPQGDELVDLSIATIRSVVKGVLGVAVLQAILSAVGLVAIGVPAAGIWAGIVLVLAIVQLPPVLILLPIAIWVYSTADAVPATIFLVYSLIVSGSDAFLKPMLLGRGLETPMLVILIGAIGGAMTMGIIGLFVGAVILSIGYQILRAWMTSEEADAAPEEA